MYTDLSAAFQRYLNPFQGLIGTINTQCFPWQRTISLVTVKSHLSASDSSESSLSECNARPRVDTPSVFLLATEHGHLMMVLL